MTIDTPWLTLDEAAAYVRLHPDTVRKAAQAGRLSGCKTSAGRNAEWRFTRTNLDDWLESGRMPSLRSLNAGRPVLGRRGSAGQRSAS